MQLNLTGGKNGVLLPVRVKPRARSNKIEGVREGAAVVCVTAAPTHGQANAAVLEVLAKSLGCPKSSLRLERGQKSRDKVVSVALISAEEILARLKKILPEEPSGATL